MTRLKGVMWLQIMLTTSNSQTPTGRSPLIPNLLLDAEDDRGVDLEFLAEVVKLFEEQDDLKPAIITTVEQMSQELSAKTMNDDYKPYVTVCISTVDYTNLVLIVIRHSGTSSTMLLSDLPSPNLRVSSTKQMLRLLK